MKHVFEEICITQKLKLEISLFLLNRLALKCYAIVGSFNANLFST